uniref:Uncharacterized protein n=1 Tax=Vespula pensylvanica TaxID=30213 RepID=A0A834U940_VESPE|nr:hypothetical protein H0235_008665 [Vespula pensylvanica]
MVGRGPSIASDASVHEVCRVRPSWAELGGGPQPCVVVCHDEDDEDDDDEDDEDEDDNNDENNDDERSLEEKSASFASFVKRGKKKEKKLILPLIS